MENMASIKDKYMTSRIKREVRLRDLDRDTLQRQVKEIEERDKVQYRKTCGNFQQTKKKAMSSAEEFYDVYGSSSNELIEYSKIEPYRLGALGVIPCKENKRRVVRRESTVKKIVPKDRSFDWVSAFILSDLGLLNKFRKKGKNNFVKMESTIKENRRYYV